MDLTLVFVKADFSFLVSEDILLLSVKGAFCFCFLFFVVVVLWLLLPLGSDCSFFFAQNSLSFKT